MTPTRAWRRSAAAVSLVLLVFAVVGCSTGRGPDDVEPSPPAPVPPNIVFVMLDDMDAKVFEHMPRAKELVADQGVTFENFFFNLAQCCPSRATMLRGQYSHNTEIYDNGGENGGFQRFYRLGHEESTYATWLQDAGYTTGYLGKYLNGYPRSAGLAETYVPPGWDRWFGFIRDGMNQFGYQVNDDGVARTYGLEPEDYATDVLAAEAYDFVERYAKRPAPFLLVVSPTAPHKPSIAAPRHQSLFPDLTYPRTPSFDERDLTDKPSDVRRLKPLDSRDQERVDAAYGDRVRAVQAVDELVAGLVERLEAGGELADTVILVGSDNGFHMGEHRLLADEDASEDGDFNGNRPGGKSTQYLEDVRVPLYMRGPGIPAGTTVSELVGNVDLAPTFAELAGAEVPGFVDGRSFLPLAQDEQVTWRSSYLIERWSSQYGFAGLYTARHAYVRHANGDRELYDLAADPWQLDNLINTSEADQALVAELDQRVTEMSACLGQRCRDVEGEALADE